MKFLQINELIINTDCITQIFIERETKPPFNYNIIVFYKGYNIGLTGNKKQKQICYYKKDIEDYDKALKIFQELLKKLNN